jgi:hypothetical protein
MKASKHPTTKPVFLAYGEGEDDDGIGLNFDFNIDPNDNGKTADSGDNNAGKKPSKAEDDDPQPKTKKDKDDSIQDLRKQRDALRKELDALKPKVKEVDELKPLTSLKKVAEYIASKTGKKVSDISEDDVDKFIEKNKGRKKELNDLSLKFKEKDDEIKELSIERSDEWRNEYQKPIEKAAIALSACLDQVDGNGKSKHPEFTQSLLTTMSKCVNPKDGSIDYGRLKMILRSAEDKYKATYEDEPDPFPTLSEVSKLLEVYTEKAIKANDAKQNWFSEQQKKREQKTFEEAKALELRTKREKDAFEFVKNKLKTDFKSDKWDVDDDEFSTLVDEHVSQRIEIMEGKRKAMSPTDFIARNIKADRYDALFEENKKLKAKLNLSKGVGPGGDSGGGSGDGDDEEENTLGLNFNLAG